jgi:hypothetical protein
VERRLGGERAAVSASSVQGGCTRGLGLAEQSHGATGAAERDRQAARRESRYYGGCCVPWGACASSKRTRPERAWTEFRARGVCSNGCKNRRRRLAGLITHAALDPARALDRSRRRARHNRSLLRQAPDVTSRLAIADVATRRSADAQCAVLCAVLCAARATRMPGSRPVLQQSAGGRRLQSVIAAAHTLGARQGPSSTASASLRPPGAHHADHAAACAGPHGCIGRLPSAICHLPPSALSLCCRHARHTGIHAVRERGPQPARPPVTRQLH